MSKQTKNIADVDICTLCHFAFFISGVALFRVQHQAIIYNNADLLLSTAT